MKFLLFNLVVAGSLYYLFNAGDLKTPVLDNPAQAAVAPVSQSVTPTAVAKVEEPETVAAATTPPAPPADLPDKKTTPVELKPVVKNPSVDTHAAKPRTRSTPTLPPEVAQRRAEVLGELPVTSVSTTTAHALMSPSIRRQELHALAEEMEYRSLGWRIE